MNQVLQKPVNTDLLLDLLSNFDFAKSLILTKDDMGYKSSINYDKSSSENNESSSIEIEIWSDQQ